MAPQAGRAAVLGLALTATLIAGGAIGYRVATASLGVTDAVSRTLQPSPAPMRASFLAAAPEPAVEDVPSAAQEQEPSGEQRLREFKDAFGSAWREGIAQAATGPAEIPGALAETPIPSPSGSPPAVTAAATATPVAEAPITAAAAAPIPIPIPTTTTTATQTPTATETPTPSAAPATSASADSPTVTAAPGTMVAPPVLLTAAAVDAEPQDLHVIVYSASWCSACQDAKAWMTAAGIPFEERDIDSSPEYMQQLKSLNRRMSIPTFDVDGKVMVGFYPRQLVWMLQRAVLRRAAAGSP